MALSSEIKEDILVQNKLSNYLVLLPVIVLTLITGFRSYDVGTDTGNYYFLLWMQKPELNFSSEFLFQLIALLIQHFDLNYTYFLSLVSIIFFYFIYKALKNYSLLYQANLLMALFAFMSFFFFSSMSTNVIRQGVSLAILLYAFTLLLKKDNKIKIIIYSVVAVAFHLTSIIPILLVALSYHLSTKSGKLIYFLVLLYFSVILLAFLNIGFLNIAPSLSQLLGSDGRSSYLNGETYDYVVGFKPQFVVFNTFFLLIALYIRKNLTEIELKKQYNVILIYYIIASWLLFLAFQLPFSDRWGLFSWVVIPFLIIPLFYSPYLKAKIRIHYILMLILIYVGFKFYAS
nr:EpsG family protein [Moraxella sp. CTOTU49097]